MGIFCIITDVTHAPFTVAAELALPEVDFASKTNGTSKTNESRASSAATKTRQKPNGKFYFETTFCVTSVSKFDYYVLRYL